MRLIDKILGWMFIILIAFCLGALFLSLIKSVINFPENKASRIVDLIVAVVGFGALALASHPKFRDEDEEVGGIEILYMLFGGMAICGLFYLYHIFIFLRIY